MDTGNTVTASNNTVTVLKNVRTMRHNVRTTATSFADVRPPSVDALARQLALLPELAALPQPLLVDAARTAVAEAVAAGEPESAFDRGVAAGRQAGRRLLQPVINGTGTLLHTNLGRAPQSRVTRSTQSANGTDHAAVRYLSLEIDLESGERGSRRTHAGALLARLCGAESALVVNNCAAAVLLVLAALAQGASVAVSRGELVEIGGGFRIPDVMEQSGAQLVEVGTTNRTRLADYRRAVDQHPDLAMLLKVHQSNYRITGFVEETSVGELATLGPPVVVDIGSGLVDSRLPWLADASGSVPVLAWLDAEPGARQTLDAGADLVMFSGDKLLGGPQAGIIVGRTDLVDLCARHPLARALRPGGLVLAELQRICIAMLEKRGRDIAFWQMATLTPEALMRRAVAVAATVGDVRVQAIDTLAVTGGGTLPGITINSAGIMISAPIVSALRSGTPPLMARMDKGSTVVDLRTVDPADDVVVAQRVTAALAARAAPA